MPNRDNHFEELLDRAAIEVQRTVEKLDALVGSAPPLGKRRLTGPERVGYFKSQPDERKLELWGQMDENERQEIGKGLTNSQ